MADKLKLMMVDDEQAVLDALTRLFRREFDVCSYTDARDALVDLASGDYAVIISDMRMPVMSGAEFLKQAYELKPDTPRLLLTGYSDIQDTSMAINEGKIANYIAKPWHNRELKAIVEQAAEQYQLKQSVYCLERQLKDKNQQLQQHNDQLETQVQQRTAKLTDLAVRLKRSQKQHRAMFQDVIEMINLIIEEVTDEHDGHIKRVASHCRLLAEQLGLSKTTVTQCYLTGLMHEIGKVSIDDDLIVKHEAELDRYEANQRKGHAVKGADILAKVPHLKPISTAIRHQYEWFNGSGYPDHLKGEDIPIASRVLAIVNDFDKLLIGRATGHELTREQAINHIENLSTRIYDPKILAKYMETLDLIVAVGEYHIDTCVSVDMLEEGMILSRDLTSQQGAVLLTKDSEINTGTIKKLQQYQKDWDYFFNVFVH